MRLYDIPEDRRYGVEEWSLSEIQTLPQSDLESLSYFTYINDDETDPEELRPGIIVNGQKQMESFYICGKHRYVRYGFNKDKYTTIDYSNKLFDVKVNTAKGWIITGGICIEIPSIKDFNRAVRAFVWGDYIYKKIEFKPKRIECRKFYSPTLTIKIPLNDKYEFTIRGASYTNYDLNYDRKGFGKGDLRFCVHRRTWFDYDQTSLSDLINNETGFVGFEVLNMTLFGHHETIYSLKILDSDRVRLFGTRNEYAIICGDPQCKTLYIFKDNDTVACCEIIVNTLEEYYLLGTWLTKAAEEINSEYSSKYSDGIFVSHPTNITDENGQSVNDSVYVKIGENEERVRLHSGRFKRRLEDIYAERKKEDEEYNKLPNTHNTMFPISEISLDSKFSWVKEDEEEWESMQQYSSFSDSGNTIVVNKGGERFTAYNPIIRIKYRTIEYTLRDSWPWSTVKIEYFGKKFNPKADPNRGIVSVGEYDFIFEDCFYYNWFIAFLKEADKQLDSNNSFKIRSIDAQPFRVDDAVKSLYGIEIDPFSTKELSFSAVKYTAYEEHNDVRVDASGDISCYIKKRQLNGVTKGCIADMDNSGDEYNDYPAWPEVGMKYERYKDKWGLKPGDLGTLNCFRFSSAEKNRWELCGDEHTCTLYYFPDESHLGGCKIQTRSIEDYYKLGEWINTSLKWFCKTTTIRDYNIQKSVSVGQSIESKDRKPAISDIVDSTPMAELDNLVGLESLKNDVHELISFVKMQKARQVRGFKTVPVSLHLVFTGNPGTGKTTVARIIAQIYKEIGILSKGQLIEVDRSGLVAGYVGQTSLKTMEKIEEAIGGVLFIDEAYTLVKEGSDYGQEAIDTLIKAMEDHRDNFVVIVAGYPELMSRFINSNPGLKSRFNKYFYFPDYEAEELEEIFDSMCMKYDYSIDDYAKEKVRSYFEKVCASTDDSFSNARGVRNLFEKIIANQATRVMSMHNLDEEDMITIKAEDIDRSIEE